jgi:hypothetical protein
MIRRLPIALVSSAIALGVVSGCDMEVFMGGVNISPNLGDNPATTASPTPTPHPDHLKYVQGVAMELRKDNGTLLTTYTSDYFDLFQYKISELPEFGHFRIYFQEKSLDAGANGFFIWNNKKESQQIEYINRGFFDFLDFDEAPERGWEVDSYLDRKIQKAKIDELILFRITDTASSSMYYGKIKFKELYKEKVIFDYILNTSPGDRAL